MTVFQGTTLQFAQKRDSAAILRETEPSPLTPALCTSNGRLFKGDNLGLLRALVEHEPRSIALIYLDPPFATGRTFRDRRGRVAYHDTLTGSAYLDFIWRRLVLCRELLSESGSIYVHLGPQFAPYIRIMMDELFGMKPYHRSIIWKRSGSHPNARSFGNTHDVILFYPKSRRFYFAPDYQAQENPSTRFPLIDDHGRRFAASDLSGESLKTAGDPAYCYTWNGHHRIWRCRRPTMERYAKEGRIYYTGSGLPRKKRYQNESRGIAPTDVWDDIPSIHPKSGERAYPTQKPERLLERIIRSSTRKGDQVLDPFCGSGRTLAVANRLDRRWVGIDCGVLALDLSQERLPSSDE